MTQHGSSESLGSLTEISHGPLSNRTLTEVSTFKALTCPSDIPVDTLCCHEYGHEYSTPVFFLSDGVERGKVPPAVLFYELDEVPYAFKMSLLIVGIPLTNLVDLF